jgi:hypothetical protein
VLRGVGSGNATSLPEWLPMVWGSRCRGDMGSLSRIWFMSLIVEEDPRRRVDQGLRFGSPVGESGSGNLPVGFLTPVPERASRSIGGRARPRIRFGEARHGPESRGHTQFCPEVPDPAVR